MHKKLTKKYFSIEIETRNSLFGKKEPTNVGLIYKVLANMYYAHGYGELELIDVIL
jgi:hypothetical protein